jgi:hypothetical protein
MGCQIKKILFLLVVLFPTLAFTLEVEPWGGNVYQFHFLSQYSYSRFTKVNHAVDPLTHPFHANTLYFDLEFAPSSSWDLDMDVRFSESSKEKFSFRTTAIQARYIILDDIVGDMISLMTGLHLRYVSPQSLRDISDPYHGAFEGEVSLSLGREWASNEDYFIRVFGFGCFGQSISGAPWFREIFGLEGKIHHEHKVALFLEALQGFGGHHEIDINHFHGYGQIHERFVDATFRYGYQFGVYGTLRLEYSRRFFARICPSQTNTFTVAYLLPFSF